MSEETEQKEEQQKEEQQKEESELEQRALDQGWNPNGKKSAEWFLEFGGMKDALKYQQRKLRQQEHDFNYRLDAVNKMHKAQLEITITELSRKRDEAVEDGNVAKVKQYQIDIDTARDQQLVNTSKPVDSIDPIYTDWVNKNQWFNENTKKAKYALVCNNEFTQNNPSASPNEVIAYIEKEVSDMFPKVNTRREEPSITENQSSKSKHTSRDITMKNLTIDEQLFWERGGHEMFASEKDFLKVVKDARAEK